MLVSVEPLIPTDKRSSGHWLMCVVLASGCFNPTYDNPACGANDACPSGFRCIDHICRNDGPDGVPDAASADAAPDGQPSKCPSGYGPINGIGMYRVVEPPFPAQTWQDAAADCNDDDEAGGPYSLYTHLVVLGDETERIAITTGVSLISGNTWIGLSDLATEGTHQWVTAEPTDGYPVVGMSPPWDVDDPDDAGGVEDCIRIKNDYTLEDKPCAFAESYVCECDAFPPN